MHINDSTNASNHRSVDEPRPASTGDALNRIGAVVSRVLEALYINALMTSLSQFCNRVAGAVYLNGALFDAAEKGDVERVRTLLWLNANPNAIDSNENTPLHYAAQGGYIDIMTLLLEHGALVNHVDWQKYGALTYACHPYIDKDVRKTEEQVEAMVTLLLQYGAQPNVVSMGTTPLNMAAQCGYSRVVELLIKGGALLEGSYYPYETPLGYAVKSHDWVSEEQRDKTVNILFQAGADPNVWVQRLYSNSHSSYFVTPLHLAAHKGYTSTVDLLLYKGAKINEITRSNGNTALMLAARAGRLEVVSHLIDYGADKALGNRDGETALSLTARVPHDLSDEERQQLLQQQPLVRQRLLHQPHARFPGPLKV